MRALVRTQLGDVARRPSRLLLTGLAVLVASFVVVAAVLVQQILVRTVAADASDTPAAADLVIGRPDGTGTTTTVLRQVQRLEQVAQAAGRLEVSAVVGPAADDLRIVADPGHGALATVKVLRGSYPDAAGEIAVTARTAKRMELPVGALTTARIDNCGSDVGVCTEWRAIDVTVTAVVEAHDDSGHDSYAPDSVVTALAGTDHLAQIDLRLAGGADLASVRTRVADTVAAAGPGRPAVRTGAAARADEARLALSQLRMLFILVGMFVAIAVVAAGLVATSTFRVVFAARLRQLALLRLIGASRGGLVRALVLEGACTGLAASGAGVLLALAAGQGLPLALRAFGQDIPTPGVPVFAATTVMIGATVITVLAVIAPAFSAARVAPLQVLRAADTTQGQRGIGLLRWVIGLLLTAGGGLSGFLAINLLPGPAHEGYDPLPVLGLVVLSATLVFVALVFLGPVVVRPVLWAANLLMRRFGPVGRLAVAGVGAAPRRAAAVSAIVALGVALLSGVLIGGASLRGLSERELALAAPADFEIRTNSDTALPVGVVDRARARTDVTHVAPYRWVDDLRMGTVAVPGQLTGSAVDLDMDALPRLRQLDADSGDLDDLGPGQVVLDRATGLELGLAAGDRMVLARGSRTIQVDVAAVLPDRTPLNSSVMLDPADLNRLSVPAAHAGLLADATRPGEDGRAMALKGLRQLTDGVGGVNLIVLADQRDEMTGLIDAVIGLAAGLVGLTVLIAVVGVGTTTALTVAERRRESGLLRAVGMSRRGLLTMLTAEAGLYGMIGAVLGLVLGVPYGSVAVQAVGASAPLTLPVGQLAGVLLGLIALTAFAGVLPAWRASRVSPVTAISTDA